MLAKAGESLVCADVTPDEVELGATAVPERSGDRA
jgi:hypothetical protein